MRKNPEAPKGRKSHSLGREPQDDVMRKTGKPRRGDRDSFAPLGLVSISTPDPGLLGFPGLTPLGYFCSAPLGLSDSFSRPVSAWLLLLFGFVVYEPFRVNLLGLPSFLLRDKPLPP